MYENWRFWVVALGGSLLVLVWLVEFRERLLQPEASPAVVAELGRYTHETDIQRFVSLR